MKNTLELKITREEIYNIASLQTNDGPILVIGDIQGDISIFYKFKKLCETLRIENLLDPFSKTDVCKNRNIKLTERESTI